MQTARQQRGEISFGALNDIHIPIAFAAMLLLVPIMGWAFRARGAASRFHAEAFADMSRLAGVTALSLLGNAAVCGIFANPHDRYGARLVWLAPLVVVLACYRAYALRPGPAAARQPAA
jgi:hypothetical protein